MAPTMRFLFSGILALCSLHAPAGAQSPPFFDSFAYAKEWSTPIGLYRPQASAALVESSPNGSWRKLVWARGRYWPLVDYLAENVTTSDRLGPSRLTLSVTPRPGPGLPAGGAEILADRNKQLFGFGSYRVRMKASPPTPKGIGVCNAVYIYTPQVEIDIEFLSVNQGNPPGTGQVEMAVHDHMTYPNDRISRVRYINLPFDPSKEFHVYGFDWHPHRVEFFVDSELVAVIRTGDQGNLWINNVIHKRTMRLPDANNMVPDVIRMSNWTDLPDWCGAPPPVKTDFEIDWVSFTPYYFTTSATTLSTAAGGRADFQVDAGPGRAGSLALLLASPFETDRGLPHPFRPGATLPFEFDWALLPTIYQLAGLGSLPGFLSFLDGQGQGTLGFRLQPRQAGPEAVGARLHFACLTVHPLFGVIQAGTNRVRVELGR